MLKPTLIQLSTCALISGLVVGCGTTREAKWDEDAAAKPAAAAEPDAADKAAGLVAAGDEAWMQRADKGQLEAAIAKYEEAAAIAPSPELFTKLSRAHYFLGDGHYGLAGDAEGRDAHYTKGLDWAERSLKLGAPEFVADMKNGAKFKEAIKKAPKDSVPAMYWYSTNMGKWASAKGFATILRYKDDIKATMDHVMALDPNFFHAAPFRYFGAFEARTAGIAGGSLEESEKNFKKAVELAPNYLATKVLWAEYLCVKQKEGGRETFEKLLNEVISADPATVAELEPENRVEQEKAKKLLARTDELF
jgi:tetratricopeptide (TPR) repeat protein